MAVLAGVLLLLQGHSMAFWVHWLGWAGMAWSLLLEAVAAWLWWQPRRRFWGGCASLLLIIGPLYHVSAPVLAGGRVSQANIEVLATLRAEVVQREQALSTYLQNSTARPGWLSTIQEAQEGLDRARENLRQVTTGSAEAAASWQRLVVLGMQLAALVLFQWVAILAIKSLADSPGAVSSSEAPPAPRKQGTAAPGSSEAPPLPASTPASLAGRCIACLDEVLRTTGQSQNAWGKAHGFSSKQMSQVRNHDRVVRAGIRGAPERLIERMAMELGVKVEERA